MNIFQLFIKFLNIFFWRLPLFNQIAFKLKVDSKKVEQEPY